MISRGPMRCAECLKFDKKIKQRDSLLAGAGPEKGLRDVGVAPVGGEHEGGPARREARLHVRPGLQHHRPQGPRRGGGGG